MRRFLLWDYPRASWQYDVMVLLILAFLFLTPRELFRDQPRASSVVLLPSETGAVVYWIEEDLIASLPESSRLERAQRLVSSKTGRNTPISRVEPIFNAEKEVKGFLAFVKP